MKKAEEGEPKFKVEKVEEEKDADPCKKLSKKCWILLIVLNVLFVLLIVGGIVLYLLLRMYFVVRWTQPLTIEDQKVNLIHD